MSPQLGERALRTLLTDVKAALGVGDQMADTLINTHDWRWQRQIIDKYGASLSGWQRDDLARRLNWPGEDEEDDEETQA